MWEEGLILKLIKNNISNRRLNWVKEYVSNRKATVRMHGYRSNTDLIKNGVPQGGVLSPTLFLIYKNDIKESLHRKVKCR